MKKLAVIFCTAVLALSLSAASFAATNPFMDVPMNHWAYDAIGQLAAHGILSGFPDGTYKGQQQTTRYEMASALARALAVVDMTKASKQDVEMLKRLVVEFKDELEALGVRVDELDERVAVLENRLGGWHMHGTLVLDVVNRSANEAGDAFGPDGDGSIGFDEARILFERTFGEDDEYFFRARIRNETGTEGKDDDGKGDAYFDRFYVDMPFFFDSQLTVGRFSWGWEGAYKISLPETGGTTGDQILTDWTWTGLGLTKNFGLGQLQAVFAHPDKSLPINEFADGTLSNWMVMARASVQFTEQIGLDIGGQVYVGDNAEWFNRDYNPKKADDTPKYAHPHDGESFNKLWTIFAGLRFNFNDAIALKGIFYHQAAATEIVAENASGWSDYGYGLTDNGGIIDDANHWAVIVDVKQEALKFTSLWLEYGQFDKGFITRNKTGIFYSDLNKTQQAQEDVKYWRVGLGQEWNEKWSTYLFYYGYVRDGAKNNGKDDLKPSEYGIGVSYNLNDYTTFGLNYLHADNDKDEGTTEDNVVKFRTAIHF